MSVVWVCCVCCGKGVTQCVILGFGDCLQKQNRASLAWGETRGNLLFCIPTAEHNQKNKKRTVQFPGFQGAWAPPRRWGPLACPVSATTQAPAPATLGLNRVSFACQDATIAMSIGQDKWWPRAADLQCRGPQLAPGPEEASLGEIGGGSWAIDLAEAEGEGSAMSSQI